MPIEMNLPWAPYGTWESPVSAAHVAKMGFRIEDLIVDPKTSKIYVIEQRPSEGGRNVVVSVEDNIDLIGKNWNARTRVHEYGGASAIIYDGVLYFSNINDGRVYQVEIGRDPVPITSENPNHRFGDFTINHFNTRWLVCVLEDHSDNEPVAVKNSIVVIDTLNHRTVSLISGHDFYTNPRFSLDGKYLVWRQWNHPCLPWEGSEIFVASCLMLASEGGDSPTLGLRRAFLVAGEPTYVGVAQPSWTSSNELLFLSDIDRYMNPWIASRVSEAEVRVEAVLPAPIQEDFGELDWTLGLSSYALLDDKNYIYSSFRNGRAQIYLVDLGKRTFRELDTPYAYIRSIRHVSKGRVAFLGKMSNAEDMVVELRLYDPEGKPQYRAIKGQGCRNDLLLLSNFISLPQPIQIRVLIEDYRVPVHVVYYPPLNPDYLGGHPDELPPAIIEIHGGPTLMADQGLDWTKQYFTSRGWAWIDLNYSGSAGYGRDYRERLRGSWGVLDVNDAVDAVNQLGKRALIDRKRTCIRGASAGGFTTLTTLSTKPGTFVAGVSFCGATDLAKLQRTMPKLMSHMIEELIGGSLDEIPHVWEARSPLNGAVNIKVPLLVLQGAFDPLIPAAQSEDMVKKIEEHGGQVKYVVFEGEGHYRWKRADTIERALEEELAFYRQVLGLMK